MDSRGGHHRLVIALWFLWAAAVLNFYYARFGELLTVDPRMLEETSLSLAVVPTFLRLLKAGG